MNRKPLIVAAAAVLLIASATQVMAAKPDSSAYAGASWFQKYLTVSNGAASLCDGNSGTVPQQTFGNNVDASNECGSQSEESIAINPANPQNVIAGSNEIQRLPMRAMYSTDGGTTFSGVDLPLPPARTNNGFDFGSDPGVAFDSAGSAYYSYIVVFFGAGGGINGTAMAVAHSTDGGATWTATYFAPETGSGQFNDKPMITVDTGTAHHDRVYVAWDHATGNSSSTKNGNNVLLSYSDDGGGTFSTPVSVSGAFTGKTGGIGADPYVTSDGTLHVAWQDYAHGTIADAASTDGGRTFSAPHTVASVASFEFAVAAQSSRGALVYPACGSFGTSLYCSYMNGSDAATSVFVARSSDGGLTWTSTAVPAGGDQFNQWLAVDPSDGSVNVAYYDTGTHGATSTIYTLARSSDGGATYTASAIANAPTDETCCAPSVNLGNQYGDYEGVAALNGTVRPVWVDRRQDVIDLGLREEAFTATLLP
jgi:Neuraminidase (sialidase)